MKYIQGISHNIQAPLIGVVTNNPVTIKRANKIFLAKSQSSRPGFLATIHIGIESCTEHNRKSISIPPESASDLSPGDCIQIEPNGLITVLWDQSSNNNSLLITEACNCNCLMCPQPPKPHNQELYNTAIKIISLIKPHKGQPLCITGGEPTLYPDNLLNLLQVLEQRHPHTPYILLSNGKYFSSFDFTSSYAKCRADRTTCISLHSDIDVIHDKISGSTGGFYKTVKGLYNLAKFRERIEIRIVINKLNYDHLQRLSTFIYRNFPFVYHVAFMGQEITGRADSNFDEIWVDPFEYRHELSTAIQALSRADVNTSIYNIPLCILNRDTWAFARKSISDWKTSYLPICSTCSVMDRCAGVFTTSGSHNSPHINPL